MVKRAIHRWVGLQLAGAKNEKTVLSVMERHTGSSKIFLTRCNDHLGSDSSMDNDQSLRFELDQLGTKNIILCTQAALELPPCLHCSRASCRKARQCNGEHLRYIQKNLSSQSTAHGKEIQFTGYTQRPVELYLREYEQKSRARAPRIELDETLGGSRAPITARMHAIIRDISIPRTRIIESSTRLFARQLIRCLPRLAHRHQDWRSPETGAQLRAEILQACAQAFDLFIYARDEASITERTNYFESFLLSLIAYIYSEGLTLRPERGFPHKTGWVELLHEGRFNAWMNARLHARPLAERESS